MVDPENLKKMSNDEIIDCCSNIADWGFNDYEEWEQQSAVYGLLNLYKKQQKEIKEIKNVNKELKNSLIDMVNQFAYDIKRKKYENECLYTGGLSALERAFDVLNIDEEIKRKDLWKLLEEN